LVHGRHKSFSVGTSECELSERFTAGALCWAASQDSPSQSHRKSKYFSCFISFYKHDKPICDKVTL
jgi:hypothetical protein